MNVATKIMLSFIILLAASFRLYGLNWDQGYHLHPDERAIVMTVTNLKLPQTLSEFFSSGSPWNPHFFAYGSLPMYLLRIVGDFFGFLDPLYASYGGINLVGRMISALSDIGTLLILFFLSKRLFDTRVGITTSFFYAVSVLPIQLSHFYAVDTLLTFFLLLTLYLLIIFYEKPTIGKAILIGLFFGFSLATKVSATVILLSLGLTLALDFFILFLRSPHKPKHYLPHLPRFLVHLIKYFIIIFVITIITFFLLEPYALLDFKSFWEQTQAQSHMTRDAFTFPYTLQYVGKIPYLYELKNIFFFGQGIALSTITFSGTLFALFLLFRERSKKQLGKIIILLSFFLSYFFVVGGFAIGFMRYTLPIYPLLCLFGAFFITVLCKRIRNPKLYAISYMLLTVICLIWPISFMHIYTKPNTRVLASNWIYTLIPEDKTLAVEHWDDQLPIGGTKQYAIITLPMYESEHPQKWQFIAESLKQTDYLIIASNRLYGPIMKLTHCEKLRGHTCYRNGSRFYQDLFSGGKREFQKVAEFAVYPTIPLFNIPINDERADESFTVYDHPKVMIFKNYHAK